ncbi:MAG: pectin methylesterase [Lachnospiraceae bacterium]|nr:pectin methylesterase [Lachnospiraceae bacterium]
MKRIEISSSEELKDAINSISLDNSEEINIKLAPGKYQGPVTIDRPNLVIDGYDPETTIISGDLGAFEILEDGLKRGTFRTQTVFIDADNVRLKNLTIENKAGRGEEAGQAIALYADGDNLIFENCRFLGSQDTIFTAPLPEKEVEAGGFRGPKESAARKMTHQYYKNCYIEGDVDFIFGGGTAFFDNCEIFALKRDKGYITAASTPKGEKFGYVFYKCRFTSDSAEGSYYLGRPWRENAKTVILESELGRHIAKEGWHEWSGRCEAGGVYYAEYMSFGEGAADDERASYAHILNDEEARIYIDEINLLRKKNR